MRHLASAGSLALFVLLVGCDEKSTPPAEKTPEKATVAPEASAPEASAPATDAGETKVEPTKPARPTGKLNVILITVDSLRADMPWAGYPKDIAPHLTAFAKENVVYDDYRSVSSYTAQTVATLLSGRFASTLYRTGTFFTNYFDSNEWIGEAMQKQGIRTMAVHAHLYFDRAPGLRQGFDQWQMVPGLTWNAQTDESVTSDKSVATMIQLLSDTKNTAGQFFLWSHMMDPHDQYVKHAESPDFGKDNRGRYDSEVWFVDSQLGKFFEFAKAQPWWHDTVVMISADHGETFGEHGMFKHAFEVWDSLLRVPLLVRAPGAPAEHIGARRTHIDLAPTILDFMGVPPLAGFQGQSLVPEIYGQPANNREPIFVELAEDTNNGARRAVIVDQLKLIEWDGGVKKSLFDLRADPGEEKDLAKERPEEVAKLSALLKAKFAELPVVAPFGGNKLKSGKMANGPKGPSH